MALDVPDDFGIALYSFSHTVTGHKYATTHGFAFGSYAFDVTQIPADLWDKYQAHVMTRTDINISLDEVIVRVNVGLDDLASYNHVEPTTGALSFEGPPPQVCVLVKKNPAVATKRNKGRFYLPGLLANTDVNELGIINESSRGAIQDDIDDWYDAVFAADLPMYVLHNDPPPSTIPAFITGLTVDPMVATQRRRLRS